MFTMSTCQKFSFISRIKYFENMDFRRPEFIFANVWARLIYFFSTPNIKYQSACKFDDYAQYGLHAEEMFEDGLPTDQ